MKNGKRKKKAELAGPTVPTLPLADATAQSPFYSLPSHLLDRILSRLDLRDHIRLGAVCRALRRHAINDNPPISKPFSLVPLEYEPHDLLQLFVSPPPHAYSLRRRDRSPRRRHLLADEVRSVGYSQGWLFTTEEFFHSGKVLLSHRLLGLRFHLPRLPSRKYIQKVVATAEPSREDCVFAAWYDHHFVAVCRPHRERAWLEAGVLDVSYPDSRVWRERSPLPFAKVEAGELPVFIEDVAFHEGKLWVVLCDGALQLQVIYWELEEGPAVLGAPWSCLQASGMSREMAFLVEAGDRLLVVGWEGRLKCFRVWERLDVGFMERGDFWGGALRLRYENHDHLPPNVFVDREEAAVRSLERDCIYLQVFDESLFLYRYDPEEGKFVPAENLPRSSRWCREDCARDNEVKFFHR